MAIEQSQVNTALQHVGTSAGTAVTIFTMLGLVSPEQAAAIVAGMQDVTNGLQQAVGGLYKIGVIAGPLLIAGMAALGIKSASVREKVASLFRSAAQGNQQAQTEIVRAATEVITAVPGQVASALPTETKVALTQATVALASVSPKTNQALLESVVKLDNVQGIVTDKQTADAMPHNPLVTYDPSDITKAA